MSRILVTGINSPLGRAVGRKLQTEGHTVVGTVRSSKMGIRGLPTDELIALDLEDENSFTNIFGAYDVFVHVAGMSVGDAADLMKSTGLGTHFLVKRARELSLPRLIHISSMSVYGLGTEEVIGEHSPIPHGNAYHAAKWAAECYIETERESIESVSIRPPAIVGASTHYHFLSIILSKMIAKIPVITAMNSDFCFNNIVHENVIAEFISSLLESESLPKYRAVPIGSTEPMPLHQIVDLLANATDYKGQIKWVEPKSPPFRIDPTGAIELGYKPITTRETIDRWMKDVI